MSSVCNVLVLLVLTSLTIVVIACIGHLGAAITLIFSYPVPTVLLFSRKQFGRLIDQRVSLFERISADGENQYSNSGRRYCGHVARRPPTATVIANKSLFSIASGGHT